MPTETKISAPCDDLHDDEWSRVHAEGVQEGKDAYEARRVRNPYAKGTPQHRVFSNAAERGAGEMAEANARQRQEEWEDRKWNLSQRVRYA
jgi:hypothetical protein